MDFFEAVIKEEQGHRAGESTSFLFGYLVGKTDYGKMKEAPLPTHIHIEWSQYATFNETIINIPPKVRDCFIPWS